jgi:proliferating cell nuclear antigen
MAQEKADILSLSFENPKNDRVCEFDLKLKDIDAEHLAIPECDYDVTFQVPSFEFLESLFF